MILHPAVLALLSSSALSGLMLLYAASQGLRILRSWDLTSGSALQLALERRTFLVSALLGYLIPVQLLSLFFFIRTADDLSHFFPGAMCAAGTLNANPFGYPTLLLKGITFLLGGLWLILNHADSRGCDYPLIRQKYLLLVAIAPLALAESVLQALFFLRLRPETLTSCCGLLFGGTSGPVAAEIAALPAKPTMAVFYGVMLLTVAVGVRLFLKGKGSLLLAVMSGICFLVSLAGVVSFISVFFYQMPFHHCPFCLLQKEYGHIGYALYFFIFAGTIAGVGAGLLEPFRERKSLRQAIPALQHKLAAVSVSSFSLLAILVTCRILSSDFRLS